MYIRNIGKKDRVLRFLLAIIILLIVAFVEFNLTLRWVLGIVGVVLFITAMVNWCPLYSITNHSSRGQGLDKITKRDIEEAVREFSMKAEEKRVEVDIKPQSPKKKAVAPKKKTATAAKKTTTKKVTKKAAAPKKKNVVKKTAVKKVSTKKAPAKKKSATKKASAAKTSAKSVTKKASSTKKKTTASKTKTKSKK